MKRTQNVLNDGKRESRLPEPITRTQTVERRRRKEPRVEQNTGRSLDVCLIGSQRLILHIPHGFSSEKKKKNTYTRAQKRKRRKEESTEPPASAPYRKSKGEGEKSAQPEGIFV